MMICWCPLSSPNHCADCGSDEGSALVLADADNRQKQWKQMSGRNGGIRKVDTAILFSPLVHYVASSQNRNKVKTKLWQFREGERMISIYNYVNDDILAKRGWHKTNLILIAMGFLAFLLLFSFMVQEIWLAEMWTWVVIDHHSSMIRVISNKYWWGYDNLDCKGV